MAALAKDFPLEFNTLTATQAMSFAGSGAPLEIQVTRDRDGPEAAPPSGGLLGALARFLGGGNSSADSDLRINATVAGAGGETYIKVEFNLALLPTVSKPLTVQL